MEARVKRRMDVEETCLSSLTWLPAKPTTSFVQLLFATSNEQATSDHSDLREMPQCLQLDVCLFTYLLGGRRALAYTTVRSQAIQCAISEAVLLSGNPWPDVPSALCSSSMLTNSPVTCRPQRKAESWNAASGHQA